MTIVDSKEIAEISHQKNITDILTKDIIAIKAIMDIKDFNTSVIREGLTVAETIDSTNFTDVSQ